MRAAPVLIGTARTPRYKYRRLRSCSAYPPLVLASFVRAAVVGLLAAAAYAQPVAETRSPAPALEGPAPPSTVPVLETPSVNVAASRSVDGPGGPDLFAEPFAVEVTPATHGQWETTSDRRTAVWRLRVRSTGAVSINLGFTRYHMPPGGRLRVHTPDGEDVLGPYTETDNKSHGELWTPLVSGDDAVIEVAAPIDQVGDLELRLGSVNRGFRELVARDPLRNHESCHIDVACSQADPYRDQVRSVARITIGGVYTCTGSLLNNTARDVKPYFLTARHCFDGRAPALASTVVAYWNYQSPECGSGEGSRGQNQSGAVLRAEWADTDTVLLELDDAPDIPFNVYFAGWNRGAPPASAAVIHHPAGHVKSISLTDEALTVTRWFGNTADPDAGYLRIGGWEQGAGEPGSSGAPVFDEHKRVAGQLRGGAGNVLLPSPARLGWEAGKRVVRRRLREQPAVRLAGPRRRRRHRSRRHEPERWAAGRRDAGRQGHTARGWRGGGRRGSGRYGRVPGSGGRRHDVLGDLVQRVDCNGDGGGFHGHGRSRVGGDSDDSGDGNGGRLRGEDGDAVVASRPPTAVGARPV